MMFLSARQLLEAWPVLVRQGRLTFVKIGKQELQLLYRIDTGSDTIDHIPNLMCMFLAEALSWADFFAVDVALEDLQSLADHFANVPGVRGQVLVHASMPCGGLADCGVCAVKVKKSWKMTCKDGPVFDLKEILEGLRS